MIPRLLHQIWVGPKPPPRELIQTWKDLNPDWKHRLWGELEIQLLLSDLVLRKYQQIRELNGKSDIARYAILYRYGGVYADADTKALRPLDDTITDPNFFVSWESEAVRPNLVNGAVMGSTPGHPVLELLLRGIVEQADINWLPAWQSVGPQFLTETLLFYKGPVKIFPSAYFMPRHYTGSQSNGSVLPYCDHLYMSTQERLVRA